MKIRIKYILAGTLCCALFSIQSKAQVGGYMGFAGLSYSHCNYEQTNEYYSNTVSDKGTGYSLGIHFVDLSCRLGPKIKDTFFPGIYIGSEFAGNFGAFHYNAPDPWSGNSMTAQKSSIANFLVRLNFGLQFSYKVNDGTYIGVRYYWGQNVNDIRTRYYSRENGMFWGVFGRAGTIGYEAGYSKSNPSSNWSGDHNNMYVRIQYLLNTTDASKILNSVYLRIEHSTLTKDESILYGHPGSYNNFTNIEFGVNHFIL